MDGWHHRWALIKRNGLKASLSALSIILPLMPMGPVYTQYYTGTLDWHPPPSNWCIAIAWPLFMLFTVLLYPFNWGTLALAHHN